MITIYTEQQIFDQAIAYFRIQFPAQDLSDAGFLGLLARAFAQLVSSLQKSIQDADWDAVPAYQVDADGTIRTRTSSQALDAWAFVFGIASDKPGVYGRRGALPASGGLGVPTGVAGTIILDGAQLVSGTITVQVSGPLTLPVSSAVFAAVTPGTASNLPLGTVLTWTNPPPGLNPTVLLTAPLVGGSDLETDYDLLARILRRLQLPPKGGTGVDYRDWAEEAVDSLGNSLGINRAYIYPLRSGVGTVDVVITQAGTKFTRIPSVTKQAAAQKYLLSHRPVTAAVQTLLPTMLGGAALTIRTRLLPNPGYEFDFADGGAATSINAYAAGPPRITFNGPYAALSNAVAVGQPRIQILNNGFGALATPYQRRVINYSFLAGISTLTLDAEITPPPLSGNLFYAGGPLVDPIATAMLRYIDSLGPSRESGYADPYDLWEYKVTIARLAEVILDVRNSTGISLVSSIPNVSTTGITVAVGIFAPASADYTPLDTGGLFVGPQIAWAGNIAVTSA